MATEQRSAESDERPEAPKPRSAAVQEWIDSCLLDERANQPNGPFSRWRSKLSWLASPKVTGPLAGVRLGATGFLVLASLAGVVSFLVALDFGVAFRDAAVVAACAALLTPAVAIAVVRTIDLLLRIALLAVAAAIMGGAVWVTARMLLSH